MPASPTAQQFQKENSMRIRVIDIETTGFEPPEHAICEIGWCDVVSNGLDLDEKPADWRVGAPQAIYVNPGRSIPPETSAIHHLIDDDVRHMPTIDKIGGHVFSDPAIDAFAAHNAKFERLFITDAMTGGKPWVCTYKCALRLWKDEPGHSNQVLRYSRKPEGLDRNIASVAHRAGPDAYVTAFHLRDMLNGGALLEHLVKRSDQPALLIKCHIGKERGKPWSEVDPGFLRWLLDKDFDEDVMFTARYWLDERAKAAHGAT